jgi:hypothetical protein
MSRRVSLGLKKGQNLMQKAAAAYRAGKYPTMKDALRGVSRVGVRRRRNPDDDVLFPYAERFSSETFPSLTYPDYDKMQVLARGATARAPSQVDGNLVFDAFFGEDIFGNFLTNPRKRGGRLVKGIVVSEMAGGYHVAVVLRSVRDAAYVEDDLQQAFPEGNWMREDNEVLTAFGVSVGKAKALAKQVAEMLGFPVGQVRVLSARTKMRRNPALSWKESPSAAGSEYTASYRRTTGDGAVVTYVIYQLSGDPKFYTDRQYGNLSAYPLPAQDTLTKAKEAAEQDLERLMRSNPAKKPAAKSSSKRKSPAGRRASAASRATSKAAHLGKATGEVMHEDGAYEVITARGKTFSLAELQHVVGGYIELVPVRGGRYMVVNEEGMMRDMDINPGASLLAGTTIYGPAVVIARGAIK